MASNDPSTPRNRRRRRPRWSATTVALVALASPTLATAAHPSSLKKNARRHPSKIRGKLRGQGEANLIADAAVAAEGVVPLGSSNKNLGGGEHDNLMADAAVAAEGVAMMYGSPQTGAGSGSSGSRGNLVIVQPENLGSSQQTQVVRVAVAQRPRQSGGGGDVQLHPWPHPDTFQSGDGGQQQQQRQQPPAGNEYYYKNGEVVQVVQSSPHQASSNGGAGGGGGRTSADPQQYEQWHVAQYNYGSAKGSSEPDEVQGGSSKALPSPQEDLDVVSGKQVILRPRLSDEELNEAEAPAKGVVLPPLGSSQEGTGGSSGTEGDPVVYYYDPQALRSAASPSSSSTKGGGAEAAPELALPEVVYDSSGQALKLEEVHAGGLNEVFLEVQPRAVWGAGTNGRMAAANVGSIKAKLGFASSSSSSSSSGSAGAQGQDQWIVLATVATMAVAVGALSARRLRNRRMLESCMHPELDDEYDEDIGGSAGSAAATPRYDKKFDGDAGSDMSGDAHGFGALLGGRRGGGGGYYGTGDDGLGSGLHWRGDMEKFDV